MQKGKAVGADGFAIELLLKADVAVQYVFWEALCADLARGTIPDSWHIVLYVLLVTKPPPNNACEAGWKRGRRVLMEAGERGRREGGRRRGGVELRRMRHIAEADESDG